MTSDEIEMTKKKDQELSSNQYAKGVEKKLTRQCNIETSQRGVAMLVFTDIPNSAVGPIAVEHGTEHQTSVCTMSFGYQQKSTRWKEENFFGLVKQHAGYGPKKEKNSEECEGANRFCEIAVEENGKVQLKKRKSERDSPSPGKRQRVNENNVS